ncbi:hypothetical protein BHOIPH791_14370 [Bartonella henselae]|uniref:Uncharacterized protein n=4 Tax=Bartonella TaxID=773 RepID=A0A067WG02_9HYPH|nr:MULTISPECIES: hypothetical protein [Bartonella]ATP12429.1 hypothetical protein BhenCHDE101_04570 [Bartonella henselae]ATP12465.1 hypothetical protein BhenCHDE101_04805 [Bartonella henselae]ETS04133.1 hypothetical protein Q655_01659 [Bartonella henselae JK 51]ETS08614.1 hypothetical protein Q655_00884 [Bartonella henselae JK 51]ETS09161.1 hypothetical protein Q654_00931 [Bartonella henselae JK 50]
MRDIVIVIVGILILWSIVSDMWEEAENGRNTEFQGTLLLVIVLGVLWYLEFSRNFLLIVAILLFAWRNYLGIIANSEHDRLVEYSQMAFDYENEKINKAIIQRNEAVKENSRMVDRHYKAIKERDKTIEELSEKLWQQQKQIMIMEKQNESG